MKKSLLTLLLCAASSSGFGGIIISDSFNDGGLTDGADAQDAAWYYSRSSGLSIRSTTNATPGLTNTASYNSNNLGDASFIAAFPSAITLASTGDYIEVSYQYVRGDEQGGNTDQRNRVGFFNGTVPTGDDFGAGFDAAVGYLAGFSTGSGGRNRLSEDTDLLTNRMHDGNNSATGQLFLLENTKTLENLDSIYNITYRVERTATGTQLSSSVVLASGGTPVTMTVVDTVDPYYTFNSISFSMNGARQWNYWDNIEVTTNVPEPATCAMLLGLGALGFVIYRRRK